MKIPDTNHQQKSRQKRRARPAMGEDGKLFQESERGKQAWENYTCQRISRTCFDRRSTVSFPNSARSPMNGAACVPKTGAWSPKQELGHLIDSAANNHIRFVLASLEGEFRGAGYAQDTWVDAHGYQDFAWTELVDLWYSYNSLLAHLVRADSGRADGKSLRRGIERRRHCVSLSKTTFSTCGTISIMCFPVRM